MPTPANSINEATTGIVGFTGTAFTATAATQHAIQVGGSTSSTLTNISIGTTGQVLQAATTADPTWSTATYPATATGTGTILRADGTNWVATTSTYPNTNAVSTLLYASSANVMAALATANNGVLITSASGVPSLLAAGTTGQVLTATTGSPATWASAGASSITLTGDSGGGLTGSSFTVSGGSTGYTFAGSGTTLTLTGGAGQILQMVRETTTGGFSGTNNVAAFTSTVTTGTMNADPNALTITPKSGSSILMFEYSLMWTLSAQTGGCFAMYNGTSFINVMGQTGSSSTNSYTNWRFYITSPGTSSVTYTPYYAPVGGAATMYCNQLNGSTAYFNSKPTRTFSITEYV